MLGFKVMDINDTVTYGGLSNTTTTTTNNNNNISPSLMAKFTVCNER